MDGLRYKKHQTEGEYTSTKGREREKETNGTWNQGI